MKKYEVIQNAKKAIQNAKNDTNDVMVKLDPLEQEQVQRSFQEQSEIYPYYETAGNNSQLSLRAESDRLRIENDRLRAENYRFRRRLEQNDRRQLQQQPSMTNTAGAAVITGIVRPTWQEWNDQV